MRNEQDNILVNGQDIENVKHFVYFGAMITENYDDYRNQETYCYQWRLVEFFTGGAKL